LQSLQLYWQLLHALGQLTLLASSDEARPWLPEMANGFVWEKWTQVSFFYESRTFWLAGHRGEIGGRIW